MFGAKNHLHNYQPTMKTTLNIELSFQFLLNIDYSCLIYLGKGLLGMIVDVYMPRLDIPFKKTGSLIPAQKGKVSSDRVHFIKFLNALMDRHRQLGHQVRLMELPLWQITINVVREFSQKSQIIYIPHKMRENWFLDDRVRYYMQMVVPNIFSIDAHGWGASASSFPIQPIGDAESGIFERLRDRISANVSKFPQPKYKQAFLQPEYVFFPCQLPHDETIKFHSDVQVIDALKHTMQWIKDFNSTRRGQIKPRTVVIKPHPANPSSMAPLLQVVTKMSRGMEQNVHWVDNVSIHQLIAGAKVVVTVNSGVGFEAILHGKSIFTFGRADYDSVCHKYYGSDPENLNDALNEAYRELDQGDIIKARKFVDAWYNTHYDYKNLETFKKIF